MDELLLQRYLNEHIPLSKALGIKVDLATCEQIILHAPLSCNMNHKKTIFGGSLYSVATLACWSLVFLNVKRLGIPCEIVISAGNMNYLAPVSTDFSVSSSIENANDLIRFEGMLRKKNKARIQLRANIFQNSIRAVEYIGDFVAVKHACALEQ